MEIKCRQAKYSTIVSNLGYAFNGTKGLEAWQDIYHNNLIGYKSKTEEKTNIL